MKILQAHRLAFETMPISKARNLVSPSNPILVLSSACQPVSLLTAERITPYQFISLLMDEFSLLWKNSPDGRLNPHEKLTIKDADIQQFLEPLVAGNEPGPVGRVFAGHVRKSGRRWMVAVARDKDAVYIRPL